MKRLLFFFLCFLVLEIKAADRNWKTNATSSAWGTAGNWVEGLVPNSGDNVFIPNSSSNFPEITSSANCKDISFSSGGSTYPRLKFSGSSSAILNIWGSFTNNAAINVLEQGNVNNFGQISFRGTATANFNGSTTIRKLVVNKGTSNPLNLQSGTIEIAEFLRLTLGNLDMASGTELKLLSDADISSGAFIDGTGAGNISGAGAGNVTVSQYIPQNTGSGSPSDFNYRFFSSPIDSDTWYTNFAKYPTNNLESDVEMIPWYAVGNPSWYDPQTAYTRWYSSTYYPLAGTPGFYQYDERQQDPNSGGDDSWYGYIGWLSTKNFTNRIKGYLIHSKITQTDRTIKWKGTVNNGTKTGIFRYTNYGETADGQGLAGNPYPSAIDWTAVYNDGANSNFNPTISIWQNDGGISNTGTTYDYDATDPSVSTHPDGIIGIGQGFFIRTTVDSNILTMNNTHRVTNQVSFYRKNTSNNPANGFGLLMKGGNYNSDQMYFRFGDQFSDSYVPIKDVSKVMQIHNSIYSIKDGIKTSIQYFKTPETEKHIPVELNLRESGVFTITTFNVSSDQSGYFCYLVDHKTQKTILIETGASYTFHADAGKSSSRFSVILTKERNPSTSNSSFDFFPHYSDNQLHIHSVFPQSSEGEVLISDLSGRVIFKGAIDLNSPKTMLKMGTTSPGVYLVRINDGGTTICKKVIRP